MKNVYDIRRDKNLYFILPDDTLSANLKWSKGEAAVVANLYYEEYVHNYLKRLSVIPEEIDVYVISSSDAVLKTAKDWKEKEFFTIKKENRGRDISALLVAAQEICQQYEYICFVHDKKAKFEWIEEDTVFWIENLWGNMLKSEKYIFNLMDIFKKNNEIGLLVPPEPIGQYHSEWFCYQDAWTSNYDNVKELSIELGLECNISDEYPVITYGSVFWCRTKALNKLFQKGWEYEDFPEEPLADDGTISHAIERILAYVAQDAGYDTGTVMTCSYAEELMRIAQDGMIKTMRLLRSRLPVGNLNSINCHYDKLDAIKEFCKRYDKVCLYGGGYSCSEMFS